MVVEESTCSHDVCQLGEKLVSGCSPCATTVCAGDGFCCDNNWDQQCVNEAASWCGGGGGGSAGAAGGGPAGAGGVGPAGAGGGGAFAPACDVPAEAASKGACATIGGSVTCNPVTSEGCTEAGHACDFANDNGYNCYPPPNDTKLCGPCNNAGGPYCSKGMTCIEGACARYCCDDGDCGSGNVCLKKLGGPAGFCAKASDGAGGASGQGGEGGASGQGGAGASE